MVDLHFIANKLIQQERNARHAKRQKETEFIMPIEFTVKMTKNGFPVEARFECKSAADVDAIVKSFIEAGFEKPVYGSKPRPETFKEQRGVVLAVTTSEKKWNGKPMYDARVRLSDGNETVVSIFNKDSVRKGDTVQYSISDKGYPKIDLVDDDDDDDDDDIPF